MKDAGFKKEWRIVSELLTKPLGLVTRKPACCMLLSLVNGNIRISNYTAHSIKARSTGRFLTKNSLTKAGLYVSQIEHRPLYKYNSNITSSNSLCPDNNLTRCIKCSPFTCRTYGQHGNQRAYSTQALSPEPHFCRPPSHT